MREAALIFPHQLFLSHPALKKGRPVFLIEEQLMFGDYNWQREYHCQKLMLHRASMKYYADHLKTSGYDVTYIEHQTSENMDNVATALVNAHISHIILCDPTDYILTTRLQSLCAQHLISLTYLDTPSFLVTAEVALERLNDTYRQTSFYTKQRKAFSIMLNPDGKPVGGKWSFDAQNRAKYDDAVAIPPRPPKFRTAFSTEAFEYVSTHYKNSFGKKATLEYPHTHEQAEQWLDNFIQHKLKYFGAYQDAILQSNDLLFHAVISPALNIGLLTPQQVIDAALTQWENDDSIPLNSIEGFIRQVIGWREFMRATYLKLGRKQRSTNFFNHTRPLAECFYNGTTGILPVDAAIKRVINHGYCHHIERLMVIGNFMLLCEFDPDEVYFWFLEFFVDGYDWVMVPNVYSMSQYADGGLITTKPYISGSNYIRKMSDYPEGEWCEIWNSLYWNFL